MIGISFSNKVSTYLFRGISIALLLIFFGSVCFGQTHPTIETVHLKNGESFTGVITEIIVDDSLRMITYGGIWQVLSMKEITNIIREDSPLSDSIKISLGLLIPTRKKERPRYYWVREKGYFFQWHYLLEYAQFGLHFIHGYKFGQFAYAGIGFGIESVDLPTSFWPRNRNNERHRIAGGYVPIFVHYSADLLKKRTTPFYSAELGYVFGIGNVIAPDLVGNYPPSSNPSGLYATTAFGIRFNTSRRFHTNLGLHLSIKNLNLTFRELHPNPDTGLYSLEYNTRRITSLFFGITLIQGI